jgi:putative ABC transport system substrate-binding protein
MKRRQFMSLLGAATMWPYDVRAQQSFLRVGFVGIQPRTSALYAAFLKRMSELGYQDGKNFKFEYIQAATSDD